MILIDFNQIVVTRIYMFIIKDKKNLSIYQNPLFESSLENDIFTFLRGIHSDYGSTYGDIIICCDGKYPWRREIFPHYKHSRKKNKDSNREMWNFIHKFINGFIQKHKYDNLVQIMFHDRVEADDIIARMISNNPDERHMIVSKDKDFFQIQSPTVVQYDYSKRKFIYPSPNEYHITEHIIRGDSSDGIPNILSDADTFTVEGKRQVPMNKSRFSSLIEEFPENYEVNVRKRYNQNKLLISLGDIPDEICELIDTL